MKRNIVIILSGVAVLCVGLMVLVRPVFAQTVVGQILDLLKNKAGFQYGDDSGFIYTKETPDYIAYAGDKATGGRHRIMLAQDREKLELSFISADIVAMASPSASGDVTGTTAVSAVISPEDQTTLILAEQILDRQATTAASIATTSATMINEIGITSLERQILASASGILASISGSASGTAELASSSDSAQFALTQEQKDFLLYIRLKSRQVSQTSIALEKQILGVVTDTNDILSKASLEEDENERKVVFHSIASGIDIHYRLNEYGIMQEIILTSKDTQTNSFLFAVNTHGMSYKDVRYNVWYFSDRYGDVFRLSKMWASDATGKFTTDINVSLGKQQGKDQLTITVSPQWLADSARVYPVIIHSGIEVAPLLRSAYPGSHDLRLLRQKGLPVPSGISIPTAIPTINASDSTAASESATPAIQLTPTPATSSGTMNITPTLISTATATLIASSSTQ